MEVDNDPDKYTLKKWRIHSHIHAICSCTLNSFLLARCNIPRPFSVVVALFEHAELDIGGEGGGGEIVMGFKSASRSKRNGHK